MRAHDLSLRQLQYAVAVADTGRFRRAAERCHVSQPALSAQLAQLESTLGAQIFERDRRGVRTTAAGEEILTRARQLLAGVDDLLASAARFADPLAGRLRIGVIPTVAPYALPEVVPALRARFPRLQLLWREDRTVDVIRGLEHGNLDAGLVALEAEIGDLDHAEVATDPFLLAVPPGHALARKRRPRAEDLDAENVLLLDDGHCLRHQVLAICGRADSQEADFRATSLSTLTQMVVGGAGVTLLPALAAAVENRSGSLVLRRFEKPEPCRTLALVWRRRTPHAAALRELAAALRGAWPSAKRRAVVAPLHGSRRQEVS